MATEESPVCVSTNGMYHLIMGLLNFIAGVFAGWQFYRFIKARKQERTKNKTIYNLSVAFFAMVVFAFMFIGLGLVTFCSVGRGVLMIGELAYFMQYLLLFALLFYRLDIIFRDT
eukprot:249578_1